jgi:hypothetical protein
MSGPTEQEDDEQLPTSHVYLMMVLLKIATLSDACMADEELMRSELLAS